MITLLITAALTSIGGHFVIRPIMNRIRNQIRTGENQKHTEIAGYIGMAERALYVFAWYMGYVEFVAVWLAFKIAVEWSAWNNPEEKEGSRAIYNLFVFGNALSILVTVVIVIIVESLYLPSPWHHF